MVTRVFLIIVLVFFNGCAIRYKNVSSSYQDKDVQKLYKEISSLSNTISKDEALDIALFSTSYTKKLANSYHLVGGPYFQNFLINIGLKKRGYCYNYADDLAAALSHRGYQTVSIYRAAHKIHTIFEHNCVVITPKERDDIGVILDGWRDAGKLYFDYMSRDRKNYNWKIFKKIQ